MIIRIKYIVQIIIFILLSLLIIGDGLALGKGKEIDVKKSDKNIGIYQDPVEILKKPAFFNYDGSFAAHLYKKGFNEEEARLISEAFCLIKNCNSQSYLFKKDHGIFQEGLWKDQFQVDLHAENLKESTILQLKKLAKDSLLNMPNSDFLETRFAAYLFAIGFDVVEARRLAQFDSYLGSTLFELWGQKYNKNPTEIDTVESITALKAQADIIAIKQINKIKEIKIIHQTLDKKNRDKQKIEKINNDALSYQNFYRRSKELPMEIIDSLNQASENRKILFDHELPNVFIQATDNSAHDQIIRDHIFYSENTSLHVKIPPDKLHLVDLFLDSDRLKDTEKDDGLIVRRINESHENIDRLLEKTRENRGQNPAKTLKQNEGIQTLRAMLVGDFTFDEQLLLERLKPLNGHLVVILGHIPDATNRLEGEFEFKSKEKERDVRTKIIDIHSAFRKAGISFFPLGCISDKHHPLGTDKNIYQGDVLFQIEKVLKQNNLGSKTSLQWASVLVPSDVNITINTRDFHNIDLSNNDAIENLLPIALENQNSVLSEAYLGGQAPKPQLSVALENNVPNLIADGQYEKPPNQEHCQSKLKSSAAQRFAPWATYSLILGWVVLVIYQARPACTWAIRGIELLTTSRKLILIFMPIIISRLNWESSLLEYGIEPDIMLPTWCFIYAILGIFVVNRQKKSHFYRYLSSFMIFVGACLFSYSNYDLAADPELLELCKSLPKLNS